LFVVACDGIAAEELVARKSPVLTFLLLLELYPLELLEIPHCFAAN
jgi:hypothetical protein